MLKRSVLCSEVVQLACCMCELKRGRLLPETESTSVSQGRNVAFGASSVIFVISPTVLPQCHVKRSSGMLCCQQQEVVM